MKSQIENRSPNSSVWSDWSRCSFVFILHQGLQGDTVFSVASQFHSGGVSSAMEGASGRSVFFSSSNRPSSSDDHSARQVRDCSKWPDDTSCMLSLHFTHLKQWNSMLLVFKREMQSETCLCWAVADQCVVGNPPTCLSFRAVVCPCDCHFQPFKHHILLKQNSILQPSCVTWSEDVSTNKGLQGNAGPEKQEVVSPVARWYLFQCQSYSWYGFYSEAAARP